MPGVSNAVFLSYASEDTEAAERIATALRSAGIEVWFDQSELRGGDAWDHSIRRQIKSCALFIAVISKNTHDRDEGYFRLEWKLAVDRCHLMAADRAFLLPVVVDDTRDDDERVPERFRDVQWTRLQGGETPLAFVERVRKLLAPREPDEPSKAGPPPTPVTGVAPATRKLWSWRTVLPASLVGTLAVVALGYVAFEGRGRSTPTAQVSKPTTQATNSIAVLPLANEGGDAGQQYFSDGLSEDLITALSQFPDLKVIGRNSSFQFRDSKDDSRTIGAKLGVGHLLEGSVRHAGDTVRVSAELIDTSDGSTQWSERYDRTYKDLFALQDEITGAVARALKAHLKPQVDASLQSERPPSGSLEAYKALLQGNFYSERGTEADTRKAIEYYTAATQLDPHYALAWSRVSIAWSQMAASVFGITTSAGQDAHAKARTASDTALTLAPDLAEAHLARGSLLYSNSDWRGAEAEIRRALTLAPQNGEAKFGLGAAVGTLGQTDKAIGLIQEAIVADPLRAHWQWWLGSYLLAGDRLDQAEQAARKAIELQPGGAGSHNLLTLIEVQRGDPGAALAAAQQDVPGYWRDFSLAMARQIGGDRAVAEASLRTLIETDSDTAAYQIAEVYALRNDTNMTFEWLDRAWNNRDIGINYLLNDPFLRRYKDDPRFAAFCRKVGLPTPAEVDARK